MKRQYEIVKKITIVSLILGIIQILLLWIEPDLKHIILTSIVLGLIVILFIFILILKFELKKIFLEGSNEIFTSRLVDYDDFQIIRQFMSDKPLSNSVEEVNELREYEKITTDYVRMHYHYLIFKDDILVAILYAKYDKKNKITKITFLKVVEDYKDDIQLYIDELSSKNGTKISW